VRRLSFDELKQLSNRLASGLHAHRVLLGHLPGVEMSHGTCPQDGDVIWTPADWAWIGGLVDVLR
jgi:acyl-coenzyme A synthetase/AMP-(fatty) acid ligase